MVPDPRDTPADSEGSYDLCPYPQVSHGRSHPSYLAALACLYGIEPPELESCRILEIGCGPGGNLIPISLSHPGTECLGIDISSFQIEEGKKTIDRLGHPNNIQLIKMDVADFDRSFGSFDFIIAHGVFSWVPPNLQERILDIVDANLSPDGIAYISYNTYPGWHTKMISRDLMRRCGRVGSGCSDRPDHARKMLNFLAEETASLKVFPYAHLLKQVLDDLQGKPDFYLRHEYLEEHNRPIYFSDFVELVQKRDLRYVADAIPGLTSLSPYPDKVKEFIIQNSKDRIQAEQFIDFLTGNSFRRSLVVRSAQKPADVMSPAKVTSCFLRGNIQAVHGSETEGSSVRCTLKSGISSEINVTRPLTAAALIVLYEAQPLGLSFEELVRSAYSKLGMVPETIHRDRLRGDLTLLCQDFTDAFLHGALNLRRSHTPCVRNPGEFPKGAQYALYQASHGQRHITNQYHETVTLTVPQIEIFMHLDGSHSRAALVEMILPMMKSGALSRYGTDTRSEGLADQRNLAGDVLERILGELSAMALLVE